MHLGLVPLHFGRQARLAAARIADELAHVTGHECHATAFREPRELAEGFAANKLDLVWLSPAHFLRAEAFQGAEPVAISIRSGTPYYHGVLYVRRDSPFRTPLDLRGHSVAWVASTSASGYIFPRVALAEMGLDADELFRRQTFVGTHGNVAQRVRRGEAACGGGYAHFHEGDLTRGVRMASYMDEVGDDEDIRVLLATPPIPADLFVARKGLMDSAALLHALTTAFDTEPDPFRLVFGIDGFAEPNADALVQLGRSLRMAEELGVL